VKVDTVVVNLLLLVAILALGNGEWGKQDVHPIYFILFFIFPDRLLRQVYKKQG
jgi:hypothetical protein